MSNAEPPQLAQEQDRFDDNGLRRQKRAESKELSKCKRIICNSRGSKVNQAPNHKRATLHRKAVKQTRKQKFTTVDNRSKSGTAPGLSEFAHLPAAHCPLIANSPVDE